MAGWLFKRRIMKLRESIYTILFYITTFTLACISLNVIEKGMAVYQSDWYNKVLQKQAGIDSFFKTKGKIICTLIAVMFALIVIGVMTAVYFKQKIDLQKLRSETAYFKIAGYRHTGCSLWVDSLIVAFLAQIISVTVSLVIWKNMLRTEIFGNLIKVSGAGRGFDLRMVLLCFIIVAGVLGFAGIGRRKNSVVTELYEK